MPTHAKIKIKDNALLRAEIDTIYEASNQRQVAQWSIMIAKRILEIASIDDATIEVIREGFEVNKLWQEWKATKSEVRKLWFQIHKLARDSDSELQKTVFRVVWQAVSSGHMKEHAMVASDYAIKTIGLLTNYDIEAITQERQVQLHELSDLKDNKLFS